MGHVCARCLVVAAELGNAAIEWPADRVTRERELVIRDVEDAAAGTVLVASLFAAVVGGAFAPHWPQRGCATVRPTGPSGSSGASERSRRAFESLRGHVMLKMTSGSG